LESPVFFVDVVCRVFRPGDAHESEDQGEEREKRAPTGDAEREAETEKTIDRDVLRQWVEEVRARLREERRLRVGDNFIGKLLVASPSDPDGEVAMWCRSRHS
jgi:hypothetical protein